MLALAGYPLGIRCTTLDPAADSPAAQVAPALVGAYDDVGSLERLAATSDVLTYEFENVGVDAVRAMAGRIPVFPPPDALEAAQDRLREKRRFESVGLPVAPYVPVASTEELQAALDAIGTPAVLKTRRLGYDGKGQVVIHDAARAEDAWRAVGEVPSLLEGFVAFDRELSIVAARGRDGAVASFAHARFAGVQPGADHVPGALENVLAAGATWASRKTGPFGALRVRHFGSYPLVENEHRDGILRLTRAPAPDLTPELEARAEGHVHALMDDLAYVGVLAVELFQVGEDLLGNEMAPRVHNTGHWTIEGAETSQFEQHLRAVTGLPLGPPAPVGTSAMVNLIGAEPDRASVAAVPHAHLHTYGKAPRPGRKLGHITVRADDPEVVAAALEAVLGIDGV